MSGDAGEASSDAVAHARGACGGEAVGVEERKLAVHMDKDMWIELAEKNRFRSKWCSEKHCTVLGYLSLSYFRMALNFKGTMEMELKQIAFYEYLRIF
eukprot:760226-Hanusia_phi.AAC.10